MTSYQLRPHLDSQVSLPSKLQKSGAKGKVPLPPHTFSPPYPAYPSLILLNKFWLVRDRSSLILSPSFLLLWSLELSDTKVYES